MNKKLVPIKNWKVYTGDMVYIYNQVEVISGKDKGKQGRILKVYRKTNKVKVEGINIV